jgi:hypothetical protein
MVLPELIRELSYSKLFPHSADCRDGGGCRPSSIRRPQALYDTSKVAASLQWWQSMGGQQHECSAHRGEGQKIGIQEQRTHWGGFVLSQHVAVEVVDQALT